MRQNSTNAAGIDIGKSWLDVALDGRQEGWRLPNTDEGRAELAAALIRLAVTRVGLEASGGYERAVVAVLRQAGFEVILFQPRQVRAYASYRLRRAKTDVIDAGLIAACAAAHGPGRAAPDERLVALAEPLRLIEQIDDDIARLKTRLEAFRTSASAPASRARSAASRPNAGTRSKLSSPRCAATPTWPAASISSPASLASASAPPSPSSCACPNSAGSRAKLAGLAPFHHSSGRHQGRRRIAGGRESVRTALYAAALPAAFRWNTALVSLYRHLKAAGKSHQQALVACARKLLIFANTVLARDTPWQPA